MPSTWLADQLGLPVSASFAVVVTLGGLLSLAVFERFLAIADGHPRKLLRAETFVAALFVLLLPHREFAQREHLMLITCLPYFGLVTIRCSGERSIARMPALVVGVVAGLGFALKPYFLAVPVLVELAALSTLQGRYRPIRPETLAIGTTVCIYGALVFLFMRDYVDTVVPLVQSIYWSFDAPLSFVFPPMVLPLLLAVGSCLVTWWIRSKLPLIFLAATGGFAVSYFLQHKGYPYHLFPVLAGAALTVANALEGVKTSRIARVLLASMIGVLLVQPSLRAVKWWKDNRPGGMREAGIDEMIRRIDRDGQAGSFLVVAVHPFPAFPTALYVRSQQVSRTNSQWFLPAVVQLRSDKPEAKRGELERAQKNAVDFILWDLSRRPKLVIVDTDSGRHTIARKDFDLLKFYSEDPRFRTAWRRYREVARAGKYRMFVDTQGAPR